MAQTSGKDDEEFFRQRGFGLKLGFGGKPALIVIDVINAFTDPTMPLGANLDPQIAAIKPLVDVAHERGVPVIFSTVMYHDADFKDGGIWVLKQSGSRTLKAGTPAVELDARMDFRPGDSLLVKKYASCFFGTDLVPRLMSRGIDTLIVTGCTTSGCVRASVVDALSHNFRPIVARDCVGDRALGPHQANLFDMAQKYADVLERDAILDELRR